MRSAPGSDERWRPWAADRFLVAGARASALASLVVGVHAIVVDARPLAWVFLPVCVLFAVPAVRPRLVEDRADALPTWVFYLWSLGSVVIVTLFLNTVVEGSVVAWVPFYGLLIVNVGFSLPVRGELVTHALTLPALLWTLTGRGLPVQGWVTVVGLYLLLAVVVHQVGEHLRLEVERASTIRREAERAGVLLEGLARMHTLDLEEVARAAVEALDDLGYEMATFGLVEGDQLRSVAAVGFEPDAELDRPIPSDQGLAGEAIRAGTTVVIDDYATWSGAVPDREGIHGAVAVPVEVDGRTRAVLLAASSRVGRPTEEQQSVIGLVAAQAARVIRSTDRYEHELDLAAELRGLEELKTDFVASVSHELRTPLTIIRGVGETLERRDELSPAQRRDLLDRLNANVDRLDGLIATLLELSRLEAGQAPPRLEPVALRSLVDDALADVERILGDRRVRVSVGHEAVLGDRPLLCHVLTILLNNAAKHTPAGTTVTVGARRHGDVVLVQVEDDGPGISESERRRVVDHFFRGGHTLRRESSGLGLGLSVASAILAQHSSELEVGASVAGGASFGFRLPVAPVPAESDGDVLSVPDATVRSGEAVRD